MRDGETRDENYSNAVAVRCSLAVRGERQCFFERAQAVREGERVGEWERVQTGREGERSGDSERVQTVKSR